MEFLYGFVSGCLVIALIWSAVARSKTVYIKSEDCATAKPEEKPVVVKPDNKKVRFFSSPQYRAERKMIEELKKNKEAGIS